MTKLFEVGKKYENMITGKIFTCMYVGQTQRSSVRDCFIVFRNSDGVDSVATQSRYWKEYKEPRRIVKYFNVYEDKLTGELETGPFYDNFDSCEKLNCNPRYKLISTSQTFVWGESTNDWE